ncbi:MAG: UvrD-helicase domain-containing protein [Candidatus Obscuribacterales bacterium]|nr:UvrD-helicase domain-containing protein [Candidatus Obscuribacterales bacterium]
MPNRTKEQQAAVESIDKHVLVSAGAGSGKTFVLVERYLEVLQTNPEASVFEIIAVTFTRKAAEEMRSRLKMQLKRLSETGTAEERERWLKHLSEIDAAKIGTIHSLCESILKSFPAEAKIDPSFQILDDLERAELLELSIDETLQESLVQGQNNELIDYSIETVQQWLAGFLKAPLQYQEALQRLGSSDSADIKAYASVFIEKRIEQTINELPHNPDFQKEANYIINNPWSDPGNQLALKQQEMQRFIETLKNTSGLNAQERWQTLQEVAAQELTRAGGVPGKDLREAIKSIRNLAKEKCSSLQANLNEADEKAFRVLAALLKLAKTAFAKYTQAKKIKQRLDFDDLISKTSNLLLREDSTARHTLSRGLRTILIDEFQDTNWTQAQLLTSLASGGAKLFLIGDDKQSIYRFQGADVGVFNTYARIVSGQASKEKGATYLSGAGELLSLSLSFRSHPQIVELVNHIFAQLLDSAGADRSFAAKFNGLAASRENTPEASRVELINYNLETEADATSIEADLVASWIQEKIKKQIPLFDKNLDCERPLEYGDIAILVSDNADFAPLESALGKADIPYVTYAGKGYLERQEIYDLENLLKWLSCEQDSHALFGVLRSPIFGFSDDLLHIIKTTYHGSLWAALNAELKNNQDPRLRRAQMILRSLLRDRNHLNLADLVRTILLKTNYDAILLCMPGGKQRSRNICKFLALAAKYNHLSLSEFLRSLQALRDLNVRNLTNAPLAAENSVKIMTIHGSKGLEFGAVLLARLSKKLQRSKPKLLISKDFGIALDTSRDADEDKPAFYLAASSLDSEMEIEERKRLLYVATTRARDYLGLFIQDDRRSRLSFASWIEDTLKGQNYVLARTPESLQEHLTLPEIAAAPKPVIPPMSLSLLDELQLQNEQEMHWPDRWQSLLRISPANETIKIHPTILGSYFHLLLSNFSQATATPTPESLLELCFHHEIAIWHPQLQEHLTFEGKRLFELFLNSSLKERIKNSKRLIHETPFVLLENSKLQNESRPDLILEDNDGSWHIIDYKTDHFEPQALERQIRQHQEQLAAYVQGFESISGHQAQAWLYFAQFGQLEQVKINMTTGRSR